MSFHRDSNGLIPQSEKALSPRPASVIFFFFGE